MLRKLVVAARQDGEVTRRQMMGRSYLVLPVVLVRSQVLRNNLGATYVPPQELEASVEAWNGVPIILRHPERQGQPISARQPDVLDERGVGFIFQARYADGELRAEAWLDEARMTELQEGQLVLETVNAGEPAEVSTGFGAEITETAGEVDGEAYEFMLHGLAPDHLALLVDEVGACSVTDGCGMTLNAEGEEGGPAGTWRRRLVTFLRGVGLLQNEMSLDEIRSAVGNAAETRWGGTNRWVYVMELFEDTAVIEVDPQDGPATLWRVAYEVDEETREATLAEEATEVERVTEFVPVANGGPFEVRHEYRACNNTTTPEEGGDDMDREELINRLCACAQEGEGGTGLRRETLEAMSDEELAHYAGLQENAAAEAEGGEAQAGGGEPAAAEGGGEAAAEAEEAEAESLNAAVAEAINAALAPLTERLDRLEAETAPARNQAAEERTALINSIVANSDYTAEELKDRKDEDLRKLAKAVNKKPAITFIGRGAPESTAANGKGDSALDWEPRSTLATPTTQTQEN